MNTFFSKLTAHLKAHQSISIFVALIIILGGYFTIHAATAAKTSTAYVLGTVQTGTVVSTVTGTGQISTSASVDLKPQVSGNLISIRVNPGDTIRAGETLFVIDGTDAARAVKTAENNVEAAKLDLLATQTSTSTSVSDQTKAVKDAYIALLSSGLAPQPADLTTGNYQLPTISGNYTLGTEGTITVQTYSSQGGVSFNTTGLVTTTSLVNSITPQPLGDSGLYILFPSGTKANLTWTITIPNKNSPNYVANENAYETAIENQQNTLNPVGSNAVTIQSNELAVTQAENSLASAEETLAQYTITAPFSGTIATVPVFLGDSVSSGTTLGTVITNQEVVTLSLNEVDVSKIAVGDKATLTFDAISGLSLTGTVSTIDPVGTVTSGVVNYSVTLTLDAQDPRVKSGMSVTAAIQTATAQNVLTVPASAIKTANGISFVMTVPDGDTTTPVVASSTTTSQAAQSVTLSTPPVQTEVQVGITDGTTTEIQSGLTENQSIVVKTTTTGATSTTAAKITAPSLLGGGGNAGGRAFRAGGG